MEVGTELLQEITFCVVTNRHVKNLVLNIGHCQNHTAPLFQILQKIFQLSVSLNYSTAMFNV